MIIDVKENFSVSIISSPIVNIMTIIAHKNSNISKIFHPMYRGVPIYRISKISAVDMAKLSTSAIGIF